MYERKVFLKLIPLLARLHVLMQTCCGLQLCVVDGRGCVDTLWTWKLTFATPSQICWNFILIALLLTYFVLVFMEVLGFELWNSFYHSNGSYPLSMSPVADDYPVLVFKKLSFHSDYKHLCLGGVIQRTCPLSFLFSSKTCHCSGYIHLPRGCEEQPAKSPCTHSHQN